MSDSHMSEFSPSDAEAMALNDWLAAVADLPMDAFEALYAPAAACDCALDRHLLTPDRPEYAAFIRATRARIAAAPA